MTTRKLNNALALTFATQRMLATTTAEFNELPEQTRIGLLNEAATTMETLARATVEGRTGMFLMPEKLHPRTTRLVCAFAEALAEKLAAAEVKYGFSDEWARAGWMNECRAELHRHIIKGDPLDVAAYAAFLWHHGDTTNPDTLLREGERAGLGWHWDPAKRRLSFLFEITDKDGTVLAGMAAKMEGMDAECDMEAMADDALDTMAEQLRANPPFASQLPPGATVRRITWERYIGEDYGQRDDSTAIFTEEINDPAEMAKQLAKEFGTECAEAADAEEAMPRYLAEPESPQS